MIKLNDLNRNNKLIYLIGIESAFFINALRDYFSIPQEQLLSSNSCIYVLKGRENGVVSVVDKKTSLVDGWMDNASEYYVFNTDMPLGITFVIHPAINIHNTLAITLDSDILGAIMFKASQKSRVQTYLERNATSQFSKMVSVCQEGNYQMKITDVLYSSLHTFRDLISIFRVDLEKMLSHEMNELAKKEKLEVVEQDFDEFFYNNFEKILLKNRSAHIDTDKLNYELVTYFQTSKHYLLNKEIKSYLTKTQSTQDWKLSTLSETIKTLILKHIEHVEYN